MMMINEVIESITLRRVSNMNLNTHILDQEGPEFASLKLVPQNHCLRMYKHRYQNLEFDYQHHCFIDLASLENTHKNLLQDEQHQWTPSDWMLPNITWSDRTFLQLQKLHFRTSNQNLHRFLQHWFRLHHENMSFEIIGAEFLLTNKVCNMNIRILTKPEFALMSDFTSIDICVWSYYLGSAWIWSDHNQFRKGCTIRIRTQPELHHPNVCTIRIAPIRICMMRTNQNWKHVFWIIKHWRI